MAIIRWNPWNLQSMLEDDWDLPTLPGISRLAGQGLNIYETEQTIVAEAVLPGLSEDKIDVSFDNGVVRIAARMEDKTEEKDKKRYFMTSMATSYNYSFRLPEGAVEAEPQAELADGILTLTFQKAKKAEPKKIQIEKKVKASSEEK